MKNLILIFSVFFAQICIAQSFVHPGLLHNKEDLDRMKKAVAEKQEPIYAGYKVFIQNPVSSSGYKMQGPMAMVGRNPTVGQGVYDTDANAAHQNALMWYITGDITYANKAKEIINAWSSTLKSITGRDAVLMAGLGPFKMVNAAEILRYTNAGWTEAEIRHTEDHFKEVIYPVLKDFSPFANGNWDAAAIKTMMAIGVFCNDRAIYERALNYYVNGHGDGRLTHYVINEEGQIQESGRDQGHTQLGIGLLAESCEIAWHQGLNLYAYADNRLLKGFEYVAKFNLGNEVPFSETIDRTGKYVHKQIARQDRGPLRAVYEQLYNHYVSRMGIPAPFTTQAAEKVRPEGPGRPGADHPGYGTLFFTRPAAGAAAKNSAAVPAAPGGLIASGTEKGNKLVWIASVNTDTYTLKRAAKSSGPYKVIAKNISGNEYTDNSVKQGEVYYYTVSASNKKGESNNAWEAGISTGLPKGWQQKDIGAISQKGYTQFDGKEFRIETGGLRADSTADRLSFTWNSLEGDGVITARFAPQVSSQFSSMGLMIREDTNEAGKQVSLILGPKPTTQVEAPGWNMQLLSRSDASSKLKMIAESPGLQEPVVVFGRLLGYYWLRLERKGNIFTAYRSGDGNNWQLTGSATLTLNEKLLIGLAASSGLANQTTTVRFDNVTLEKK